MATAQMHKTQENTKAKNWAQIFPNEQITEVSSCMFVKKLLAVAISSITYLRAIFPEHAFGDKCLEDLNLKILRDESSCPGACQVIKWVKGCFDALDKKYLKTLVIGMYVDPNQPETMIESYTFKFTYNKDAEVDIYRNDKKISSAKTTDATKNATIRLLRTLILLTNTLTSLPENVMMTMKLFYYDDVTPADYEPPGFKAASDSNFGYDEEVTNIAVGEVETPFHTVKLRVKTGKKHFEMDADQDEATQQETEEGIAVANDCLDYEGSQPFPYMREVSSEPLESAAANNKLENSKQTGDEKLETNEDDYSVRCPCGCNEDDGIMVMCSKCKFWQHGICFLITDEKKAPVDHYCDVCCQNDTSLEPTDPHLQGLTSIAVQATCLWRRALDACKEFKRIVAPQLARRLGIENTVAQGLINRLEKEEFLKPSGRSKKLGKVVDRERIINQGVPKYLKTPKSLSKNLKSNDDVQMNEVPTDSTTGTIAGNANKRTPVDSLVDKTNKMNISGNGRKRSVKQIAQQEIPCKETPRRSGRKRAFAIEDNGEFEVSNSQEYQSARKKASTVNRDIAV